jgi:hypothetical protein
MRFNLQESEDELVGAISLPRDGCTSREKPTAGAPKTLIPGEFQLASDPNACGNALTLAHCPIRRW